MRFRRLRPVAASLMGGNAPLWAALLPALAFVAAALQIGLASVDPDYWWHLTTGRWMLDHGRVPFSDPFSVTHGGQNWYAHEWLSELILGVGDRLWGYAGNILLMVAVVASGAWLLGRSARYFGVGAREALILVVASNFFILSNLAVRPQVFGWALLTLLLHELAAHEACRRRFLWHTAPLFALWINLHLSALMGGGVFALYVVHRALRWLTSRAEDAAYEKRRFLLAFGGAALSAVALCLNPRGPALIWFTRAYLNQNAVRYRYIGEWQRPTFAGNERWLFIGGALLVLVVAAALLWRRTLWPAVLVILFAAAALRATRYVPLFAIVAVPAAGWTVGRFRGRQASLRAISVPPALVAALVPACVAAVCFGAWLGGPSQFRRIPDARTGGYPVGAATWIKEHLPAAPVFDEYGWGGYLIYAFYPQRRVYMDGREEMYGERFFDGFVRTIGAEPGWQKTLADARVGATVIDPEGPLATAMGADPGWRRVYGDHIAVVFVPSELGAVEKLRDRSAAAPRSGE